VELLASVGITVVDISVKVFSEDMRVYARVTGIIDLIKKQSALDLLSDWASIWQL